MTKQFLVFIFLISVAQAYGQRWKLLRYEAHGGIGFANVMGDIGGSADRDNLYGLKDIHLKGTGPSIYLGTSYKFQSNMNVKFSLFMGTASGSDKGSVNADREFTYNTKTIEPTFQYEYYFIKDTRRGSGAIFSSRGMVTEYSTFSMYVFVGGGVTVSLPKLTPKGRALDPRIESSKSFVLAPVIPIGLGVKMGLDMRRFIGVEFGRRILFNDYVDGLKTIYSKHNDTYYAGTVFFIYKIKNNRSGKPLLRRRI